MCSWPYQNEQIISALQNLYFTGGTNSFARRFMYLFPTYELCEGGDLKQEVPIPMVALVTTAVSVLVFWSYSQLTWFTSCTWHCMSGAWENNRSWNSLPMPT